MLAPKPELRGQPWSICPTKVFPNGPDSEEGYAVEAPGYEDWRLALVHKATGWRAYREEVVESYSLAFGRGGHCIYMRYHAIRSDKTGKPLGSFASPQAALRAIEELFRDEEVMPA